MPYECASDLFSDDNVERARQFLAENVKRFKMKDK
jgi:hypothetical protein